MVGPISLQIRHFRVIHAKISNLEGMKFQIHQKEGRSKGHTSNQGLTGMSLETIINFD
jgi:hypothetical protein